jgi:hypothetical protein
MNIPYSTTSLYPINRAPQQQGASLRAGANANPERSQTPAFRYELSVAEKLPLPESSGKNVADLMAALLTAPHADLERRFETLGGQLTEELHFPSISRLADIKSFTVDGGDKDVLPAPDFCITNDASPAPNFSITIDKGKLSMDNESGAELLATMEEYHAAAKTLILRNNCMDAAGIAVQAPAGYAPPDFGSKSQDQLVKDFESLHAQAGQHIDWSRGLLHSNHPGAPALLAQCRDLGKFMLDLPHSTQSHDAATRTNVASSYVQQQLSQTPQPFFSTAQLLGAASRQQTQTSNISGASTWTVPSSQSVQGSAFRSLKSEFTPGAIVQLANKIRDHRSSVTPGWYKRARYNEVIQLGSRLGIPTNGGRTHDTKKCIDIILANAPSQPNRTVVDGPDGKYSVYEHVFSHSTGIETIWVTKNNDNGAPKDMRVVTGLPPIDLINVQTAMLGSISRNRT